MSRYSDYCVTYRRLTSAATPPHSHRYPEMQCKAVLTDYFTDIEQSSTLFAASPVISFFILLKGDLLTFWLHEEKLKHVIDEMDTIEKNIEV